jgi:hypothetical protein
MEMVAMWSAGTSSLPCRGGQAVLISGGGGCKQVGRAARGLKSFHCAQAILTSKVASVHVCNYSKVFSRLEQSAVDLFHFSTMMPRDCDRVVAGKRKEAFDSI